MRINIAKSAGFCFGVKRALDIALDTAKSKKDVRMLGDIVHNEDVIASVERRGIRKIKKLSRADNQSLLIRAHGAGQKTYEAARRLGYSIIDATCPMVKEIHRIARDREKNGCRIIVIGDKKHDEVIGIVGQLKTTALVIDSPQNIPWQSLAKIKKAAVVVQSTQNLEKILSIVEKLRPRVPELEFINTICGPTRTKQQEIKAMPLENDVMVVIGSKTSANTRRLWEISKSLNKRSRWVQSPRDLKSEWFRGAKSVGVTAGASTPDRTTEQVVARIAEIAKTLV